MPRRAVLIGLFAAPIFASEEQTQRARVFCSVVLITMILVTGIFPIIMLEQPSTTAPALYAMVAVDTLGLAMLELNRRGRTRLASVLFVGGLVTVVTTMALTAGGIR